jgi:hypothetical protein
MHTAVNRWVKISFLNLLIVSLLGVILRYKIAFPLPIVQQKFMLHAHSHFAFAGWLSQVIMALMVQYLIKWKPGAFKQYKPLLIANLITAYGMLFSFPFQGYGLFSIIFSTLNIFTAYWFAIKYWKDLKPAPKAVSQWLKAAVSFNAISSLGAFTLAFLMATKTPDEKIYLAAIYFFLHFQYNGWFFFACMGFFTPYLTRAGLNDFKIKTCFLLFFIPCFTTYFLSASWVAIPFMMRVIVTASALAQLIGFSIIASTINKYNRKQEKSDGHYLIILAGIALGIKLVLQLASTVPSLSIYIFGFRPIIIGYLHLVLLGVITLFIIGHIVNNSYCHYSNFVSASIKLFTAGIIINELLLMIQGIKALGYSRFPHIDVYLLGAGLFMFISLVMLNIGLGKKVKIW